MYGVTADLLPSDLQFVESRVEIFEKSVSTLFRRKKTIEFVRSFDYYFLLLY